MEGRTRLAQARQRRFLTVEAAAERLGVEKSTLSRWERGGATPQPVNLQKLCRLYEMTAEELGFEPADVTVAPSHAVECGEQVRAFLAHDLTMRVLALAFTPCRSSHELQSALTQIIGGSMHSGSHADLSRREVLRCLATLPFISYLRTFPMPVQQHGDVLTQCAASIAACWELGRNNSEADIALAFQCTSTYTSTLKSILKDASHAAQRKNAADLITQCLLLQAVLGWHCASAKTAVQCGQEALSYSRLTDDVPLQLSALKCLAWAYYYDHRSTQALHSMEQASLLVSEQKGRLPAYVHGNITSTLALMQAKAGISASSALHAAEKTALHDDDCPVYVDAPLPAFIRNAGLALYQQRQPDQALDFLSQIVNTSTLQAKQIMPERARIEVLNVMALASLKRSKKDKEQVLYLWKAGIQGARTIKSEQRFSEALAAYDIIESLWPGEPDVKELRPLIAHW